MINSRRTILATSEKNEVSHDTTNQLIGICFFKDFYRRSGPAGIEGALAEPIFVIEL